MIARTGVCRVPLALRVFSCACEEPVILPRSSKEKMLAGAIVVRQGAAIERGRHGECSAYGRQNVARQTAQPGELFPIAVRIVGDVLLAALEVATARCPLTNDGFNGRAAAQFALEQAVQASASATPAARSAASSATSAARLPVRLLGVGAERRGESGASFGRRSRASPFRSRLPILPAAPVMRMRFMTTARSMSYATYFGQHCGGASELP